MAPVFFVWFAALTAFYVYKVRYWMVCHRTMTGDYVASLSEWVELVVAVTCGTVFSVGAFWTLVETVQAQ